MEREYYNEEKANYIIKKFRGTSIDKIYLPLVVDIMLRRQYEYGLSDEILDRDIDSFKKNVKKIETNTLQGTEKGSFSIPEKKITISDQLFYGDTVDFEKIYKTLSHECIHAMQHEKTKQGKKDRTFGQLGNGIEEIFTECQADSLTYSSKYNCSDKGVFFTKTDSYEYITPYIDIISSALGIRKKDLLGAAARGREEFDKFLNESSFSGADQIFRIISFNTSMIHSTLYAEEIKDETLAQENIENANKTIYYFAEQAIDNRISNIKIENIEEFKKQFENIKIGQAVIGDKSPKKYSEKKHFCELKIKAIDEILENETKEDKINVIRTIQNTQNDLDLMQVMVDNNILSAMDREIVLSENLIKEYNKENFSNEMQWDNSDVVQYLQAHKDEIGSPKPTKFEKLAQKVKSFKDKILKKDEIKLLPAYTIEDDKNKSWDLSNWGIDKEQFMNESKPSFAEKQNVDQSIQDKHADRDEGESYR